VTQFVEITITYPSREQALAAGRELVEQRLAACAHISPVTSIYRWQGAVHEEPEYTLAVKTSIHLVEKIKHLVVAGHPYDLPQFVANPLSDMSREYRQWLQQSLTADSG